MPPPTVTTSAASGVSANTALLGGAANPNGADTTAWFRYATTSPGSCNDSFGTRLPGSGGEPLGASTSSVPFSSAATGLVPATTYYYCAIAQNASGTSFGAVMSFTTTQGPIAVEL